MFALSPGLLVRPCSQFTSCVFHTCWTLLRSSSVRAVWPRSLAFSFSVTTLSFVWRVCVTVFIVLSNTILLLFNEFWWGSKALRRPFLDSRKVKIILEHFCESDGQNRARLLVDLQLNLKAWCETFKVFCFYFFSKNAKKKYIVVVFVWGFWISRLSCRSDQGL